MIKSPFIVALDAAEPVFAAVQVEQLHNATPCQDWDLHTLLNHVLSELAWIPELLAGKTTAQVGDAFSGDLVAGDPKAAWHKYAVTARKSVETTSMHLVVHLPYGNVPANSYLEDLTAMIVIHTWDVARSIGFDFHIDDDFAKALYLLNQGKMDAQRAHGLIGPEIPVPSDASSEVKLLGLFGRSVH